MNNFLLAICLFLSTITMAQDAHSFSRPDKVQVSHVSLDLVLDFDSKKIKGSASLKFDRKTKTNELIVDTRDLIIHAVHDNQGKSLSFQLGASKPFMGSALIIELDPASTSVKITYESTANSAALQWLSPAQTRGKKYPFLFTQGQAILTRTWIPLQDSPGVRVTWDAQINTPDGILALMSGNNPKEKNANHVYHFSMDKPVPPYLIALAAGNIEFQELGSRTGVYAEPEVLQEAAAEFSEMEKMLDAAEQLYGKYSWGRYDVIVLPPSFPFGGMENPMLTFATPTIIAGDKSLTSLIAHELAHSWSGNLVTNATWDDFWLNEGFTVYFERRIMESLYGKEYAGMLAVLGYQDLLETIEDLGSISIDTHLKLELAGRDADDGMTDIAYEKGYLLLIQLERLVGRTEFDRFVKEYFKHFAFTSITTETFLGYCFKELDLNAEHQAMVKQWVYSPGIPEKTIVPTSMLFAQVEANLNAYLNQSSPAAGLSVEGWSTHEWLHFIRMIPGSLDIESLKELDMTFGFTRSGNSEIRFAWLMKAIPAGYLDADASLDDFLSNVGRRKFVLPLYKMMVKTPRLLEHAKALYAANREGYHPVTMQSVDEVFEKTN